VERIHEIYGLLTAPDDASSPAAAGVVA
jgi:hypothetical protein